MKKADKRVTPAMVAELSECEVFVFGSNLAGQHGGGAARTAYRKFDAEWGVGQGPTGRCYAIPTMHGGLEQIRPYVDQFLQYARCHPTKRFLLTRVGCGIAGFKDEEMSALFQEAMDMPNVTIPAEWLPYLERRREREEAPEVITEQLLMELCRKHAYEIGAGIGDYLPDITIRYVMGEGKFGYAKFGDFFFFGEDLYVWHTHEGWADDHNQDVAQGVFQDECQGRGYAVRAIFAGVDTRSKDANGEPIFTGDVLMVRHNRDLNPMQFETYALGARQDYYGFILDNHDRHLEAVMQDHTVSRVGTIFYCLDRNEEPTPVNLLSMNFNGWRDNKLERMKKSIMARYTPSFEPLREEYLAKALLDLLTKP